MLHRTISMECGVRQLAQAREAVGALQGVVAAEMVVGRNAIRVWQGEELSENALAAAVRSCGVSSMRID